MHRIDCWGENLSTLTRTATQSGSSSTAALSQVGCSGI